MAAPTPAADGGTMEIEAKTTTYDGKAHTYQIKGAVKITLPQMVVTCDEATVFAAPTEDRVLRVVFAGKVEARRGADTFRADRITYHVAERRLVAEGTTRTKIKLPAGAQGPITGP
jgi:lipopolysaccharide export system protein LptA